ncbi:ABC-2 type transport system ATP-binding protein [Marinitoga hydrogenitolerans DSM 16785]|uniref:ABC-2 type transport system ATP-binding protein n=1 Tax=Marinitoga hydrogenitolerans (strain DSM 16785 / JCM 12826 / AT1271) TaxID=1122195 RepID=A0A1M5AAW8_MARH1|nr:ABC transporter ATP-binding protein [Marinitoga hydrogenitolerans]SHF27413.1 ABC-2 type transport system ATP-binding protein [Marinitoga hydrogenitolerans DSM 16785]
MENILEVINLRKTYTLFKLNATFNVKKGKITGFIGINGSGKTTTIKSILGLALKESGIIKIFGKELNKKTEKEIKNRIGIVFDEGYFYEELTLKEMKKIISSSYSNWNEELFKKYIKRFNLPLNQKICNLSKGMKMKYAISLALSHDPELLIMDEPTSGLDPLVRHELMNILLEFMKNENKSVFFSTHITSDLDKIADDLILINNGKIIFCEDKNELLNKYVIIKGSKELVNDEIKELFLNLKISEDYFEGLTDKKNELSSLFRKDVVIEKPTIENIMLYHVER